MTRNIHLLNDFQKSTLKNRLKDIGIIDLIFNYDHKEDEGEYIVFYKLNDNIFTFRLDADEFDKDNLDEFQDVIDYVSAEISEDINSMNELFFDKQFNEGLYSKDFTETITRVMMYEFDSFYIAGFSNAWAGIEFETLLELVKNLLEHGKPPIEIRKYFFNKNNLSNDYLIDRILNLNNENDSILKFKQGRFV